MAAYLKKTGVPKSGRIVPNSNMQTRQELLAQRAGLVWKRNGCRHSFGSYRMADIKNVYQVAEEMGNSPGHGQKALFSGRHQGRGCPLLGYSSELRQEAVAGEKGSKPFW